MNPLVSLIIPIYNVEDYLERCLKSVIRQSYKNLEILLINDGSTDKSKVICDKYSNLDKRIQVFNIENGGSSIARNHGLANCNGEYIGFIDSDDWIMENMIEELIKYALSYNLRVVEIKSWDSIELNNLQHNTEVHNRKNQCDIEERETAIKRIISNKEFAVWRRLYHNSILKNRFFIEGILHQDVYYTIDILNLINKIGVINNKLYIYNTENQSIIRSKYSQKKLDSINAGSYVVNNTMNYSRETQDIAARFLFDFLKFHYDSLFFHSSFDLNGNYRKKIRKLIKTNYNSSRYNFYTFLIVYLSPLPYKIFIILNKYRIKIQSKTYQYFKNV